MCNDDGALVLELIVTFSLLFDPLLLLITRLPAYLMDRGAVCISA